MNACVSIIIPSLNEGDNLRKTVQSIQNTVTGDYEIIVVDNGSKDGSSDFLLESHGDPKIQLYKTERLGSARARNFGARRAVGDFLVFADAHVLCPSGWLSPLMNMFKDKDVAVVAPALSVWGNPASKGYGFRWKNYRMDVEWLALKRPEPYWVPMVGSGFMVIRRAVFDQLEGFDEGMINYGCEDAEICLRTWLHGFKIAIVPQIAVSHYFRSKHPYRVTWDDVLNNILRTAIAHFCRTRIDKVKRAITYIPGFHNAYHRVMKSDIWERRSQLYENRKYDDDWFFEKFDFAL